MDVVDRWTGRHASALQAALRMTHDEYAEHLGVARRTITNWHARPDITPSGELQRALDTALERAPATARARFARQLDDDTPRDPAQGVALTVALAIVTRGPDVLLVCRRDDTTGLRWQFPAGVVKPGGTPERVAVRETLAETGIHCAVQEDLGSRVHPATGVRCQYFLCSYLTGDIANLDADENDSVVWVRRDDLTRFIPPRLIFPPVLNALSKEDARDRSA